MPCSDSSSGLNIRLDLNERLIKFDFAKITCSSEIGGGKSLSQFCTGKSLEEILYLDFAMLVSALNLNADEEAQFILYMELDALKSAIVSLPRHAIAPAFGQGRKVRTLAAERKRGRSRVAGNARRG